MFKVVQQKEVIRILKNLYDDAAKEAEEENTSWHYGRLRGLDDAIEAVEAMK